MSVLLVLSSLVVKLIVYLILLTSQIICLPGTNYYCSHKCAIGEKYVPQVEVTELPNIILETIASLNEITPYTGQLLLDFEDTTPAAGDDQPVPAAV